MDDMEFACVGSDEVMERSPRRGHGKVARVKPPIKLSWDGLPQAAVEGCQVLLRQLLPESELREDARERAWDRMKTAGAAAGLNRSRAATASEGGSIAPDASFCK